MGETYWYLHVSYVSYAKSRSGIENMELKLTIISGLHVEKGYLANMARCCVAVRIPIHEDEQLNIAIRSEDGDSL